MPEDEGLGRHEEPVARGGVEGVLRGEGREGKGREGKERRGEERRGEEKRREERREEETIREEKRRGDDSLSYLLEGVQQGLDAHTVMDKHAL